MIKFREVVESILYNNLLFESEQKVNWILSQPKLVQALENRIQSDSKAPNGITVEQLLKNFDNNSVAIGKFLPWVVKMYSNNEFEYTDLGLISNYLQNFIKNSSKLEKRDINQYVTLEELDSALENIKDVKGSRETKRDAKTGAEKIYEDNKWIILIPHTKEAAIQYGKGTKWCTAGVNDNMFDYYSKDGPLYIIINKVNPNKKYQFHFETNQYKNPEDNNIDLGTFLKENPEIKKFFRSIKNIDLASYGNWVWSLTYDEWLKAVKEDPEALLDVPNEFKDYDLYLEAIKSNYWAIKYVPERFLDHNLCLEAVKNNLTALKYIPSEFMDYDFHLELVKKYPLQRLFWVPEEFKDYNMCLTAVKSNGLALKGVPAKLIDYNMCLEAVKNNGLALEYVPEEYREKIKQELGIK